MYVLRDVPFLHHARETVKRCLPCMFPSGILSVWLHFFVSRMQSVGVPHRFVGDRFLAQLPACPALQPAIKGSEMHGI